MIKNGLLTYILVFVLFACLSLTKAEDFVFESENITIKSLVITDNPNKKSIQTKLEEYKILKPNENLSEHQQNYLLALCYLGLGESEKALSTIDQSLALNAQNAEYIYTKALIYRQLNKHRDSIKLFLLANKQNPKNSEFGIQAGKSYLFMKDIENAIRTFELVQKEHPTNEIVLMQLGSLYHKKGLLELSYLTYQKCAVHHPKNKSALFNMGQIKYIQNKFNESAKHFENLLQIDPDDQQTLEKLVLIYDSLNKKELSNNTHNKLMSLYPKKISENLNMKNYYIRSIFDHKDYKVIAIQYYDLTEPTFLELNFSIRNKIDDREIKKISVSKYELIENGKKNQFHLDAYYLDQSHEFYKYYSDGKPDFYKAKEDVIQILDEKIKPAPIK